MRILNWVLLLIGFLLLTACAAPQPGVVPISKQSPVVVAPTTATLPVAQDSVIGTARKMLGVPYRYGGSSPSGFDCSGLVRYVYHSIGKQVPRTSGEQFRQSQRVALQNLRAGDLLFFRLSPPKISHVAIYDRNGRFIHAPSSGKQVSYANLDNPYWRKHLVGAGRF